MSILLSINCITYNHENYIADAIDSFLMQQTNFDFEILVGEDCSKDNTKGIVEKYMKEYPGKIRLITSEHNVGAKKNFLRLIENSIGKYIAICEGDDFWIDKYKLQKQVDYMESHPECSLCFHGAKVVKIKKELTGRVVRPYSKNCISSTEDIIIGGGAFCPTCSLLYPKKLMEEVLEFYMKSHGSDYVLQIILASKGYAYYIDETMGAYRIGVNGSWTNNIVAGVNIKEKRIKVHEKSIIFLEDFNKYTNYKYNKQVRKCKFELKIKLFALHYFAKIYLKLINLKNRIN